MEIDNTVHGSAFWRPAQTHLGAWNEVSLDLGFVVELLLWEVLIKH